MAWIYHQKTGTLLHNNRLVFRHGYSGWGHGKNNPGAERQHGYGPIPRGWYIIGKPYDDRKRDPATQKIIKNGLGPHVMHLSPEGHLTYGRTLFRIHGDNHNHTASHGCIILPPDVRHQISGSGDNKLLVQI